MVAIGDALGGLLPEQAPVAFEWPDRILVNDGCIGGIRLASASGGTAAWVVLGVMLAVEADPLDEPGHHPEVTTLGDEFAYSEQFSPADLLEAIARNFLHWVERWQDEGFGPVRRAWLARAVRHAAARGRAARSHAGPGAAAPQLVAARPFRCLSQRSGTGGAGDRGRRWLSSGGPAATICSNGVPTDFWE
jgi:biotin-(acetyl-CoA carboxylase) ligase